VQSILEYLTPSVLWLENLHGTRLFWLVNRDEWEVFNLKFLDRFSQRIYVYRAIITILFSVGEFINPIYTNLMDISLFTRFIKNSSLFQIVFIIFFIYGRNIIYKEEKKNCPYKDRFLTSPLPSIQLHW
jgi:hypothetical protein